MWVEQARFPLLSLPLSWATGGERSRGTYEQNHPFADMTFIHEGNHTLVENLINFEKMVSSSRAGICHWRDWGV